MTGTYEHSIDDKGRLFIPAKLREELGSVFYLAAGVKENLTIYPMEAWNVLRERAAALTTTQAAAMDAILPRLTEEEAAVFRRGRNAHPARRVPQNASVEEYHQATALECLFGWLYLQGETGRLNQLFAAMMGE